jgi:hypothetical protein
MKRGTPQGYVMNPKTRKGQPSASSIPLLRCTCDSLCKESIPHPPAVKPVSRKPGSTVMAVANPDDLRKLPAVSLLWGFS